MPVIFSNDIVKLQIMKISKKYRSFIHYIYSWFVSSEFVIGKKKSTYKAIILINRQFYLLKTSVLSVITVYACIEVSPRQIYKSWLIMYVKLNICIMLLIIFMFYYKIYMIQIGVKIKACFYTGNLKVSDYTSIFLLKIKDKR